MLSFLIMLSCSGVDESLCIVSKERLQSIQQQREILVELRHLDRIGKKKFKAIDSMLAEEESAEATRSERRCAQ